MSNEDHYEECDCDECIIINKPLTEKEVFKLLKELEKK